MYKIPPHNVYMLETAVNCVIFCTSFATVVMFSKFWNIYRSPSVGISHQVNFEITYILTCANQTLPKYRTQWNQIHSCIRGADVKRVAPRDMPWWSTRNETTAFVHTMLPLNAIHTSVIYDKLDVTGKAFTLIHECAHLALGARDYAYRWEKSFKSLSNEEHLENADSFVELLELACYRRRFFREAQLGTDVLGGDIGRLRDRSNIGDIGRLRGRFGGARRFV